MNTCVETVPSQLPVELVAQQPVTLEPVARGESALARTISSGSPADFHCAPATLPTKQSWFSVLWPRAQKSQLRQIPLATLPVGSLPGVGQTHATTLVERGVTTVGQLRRIPKPVLVAAFGKSIGQHIWQSARS
jgi:hypothetical protein